MRKIALLSFHNAANYGAALQAYALQKALTEKGYDSVYINYQNEHRANAYNMSHFIIDYLRQGKLKSALLYFFVSPFMFLRKCRFRRFYKQYLKCTKQVYSSSKEASALEQQYDKFIVGSDQVWNYVNNGGDFAFLLDFVKNTKKKISYSSSFGVSEIPSYLEDKYREGLQAIKYLSVRERYAVEMVRRIAGREAVLVLDPVFLVSKEDWLSLCHPIDEQYVFSYTNRPQQFDNFLKQTGLDMSSCLHYKLARATSLGDFFSRSTKVKYSMSPIDFLSVINSARLVVSASFHCISLSIILNRPFIAILMGDEGKDERIQSLLNQLNLQDRIFSSTMTLENVYTPIDYKSVNSKLFSLRKSSLGFLKSSIESD